MSDVFNEVDEELRREQANRIFRKFLPLIIIIVVVIVGGVSWYQGWGWWQAKQKAEAAETYTAAAQLLEDEKFDEALLAFQEFSNSGPKGYAALAKMQAAIATMKMGKSAEAAALFTEAATAFDSQLLSDLASLKAVMVVVEDMTLADLDARLGPMASAGRPFRALARELIASKAMEEGSTDRAREEFTLLSYSLDAPAGTRQRAQIALSLLGPAPKIEPMSDTELNQDVTLEETSQ